MLCSSINLFKAFIIDSEITNSKDEYGYFFLEAPVEMFETLYHLPGIILEVPRKSKGYED